MEEIRAEVKQVVGGIVGIDPEEIQDHHEFMGDLGADSIDMVEMMQGFSDSFQCTIPEEAASEITTTNEAVTYIKTLING